MKLADYGGLNHFQDYCKDLQDHYVVSRIENGSVNVGIDMIERIAKSFNKQIKITFS